MKHNSSKWSTLTVGTSWNDSPIVTKREDCYGHEMFARKIAELIGSTPEDFESTVYGLAGAWGSGKTSVANLVDEFFQEPHFQGWSVVWFSPWAASDQNAMLAEFAQTILSAAPACRKAEMKEHLQDLVEVASRYGSMIPGWIGDTAKAVSGVSEHKKDKNWRAVLRGLEEEVSKLNRRILVIVDDLDRLAPEELSTVLKIIRVLGRISDVHYLLVFDQIAIDRSMQSVLRERSSAWSYGYLEKFVQQIFQMPPLSDYEITSQFNHWLAQYPECFQESSVRQRLSRLQPAIVRLLTTPRKIARLQRKFAIHAEYVNFDEIRADDLLLLTILETAAPSVHRKIWPMKMEVLTGRTNYHLRVDNPEARKPLLAADLVTDLEGAEAVAVQQVLNDLFPKVKLKSGSSYSVAGHHRRGVSESEYFDRYFLGGIVDGDISDAEVFGAVCSAADGDARSLRDLLCGEVEIASLALTKGQRVSGLQDRELAKLSEALIEVLPELPKSENWLINPLVQIYYWIKDLLSKVDSSSEDAVSVVEAISTLSYTYQEELGRYVQYFAPEGHLKSWLLVLAGLRIDGVRDAIKSSDHESIQPHFHRDFLFIEAAGALDKLGSGLDLADLEIDDLHLRIAWMFIRPEAVTGDNGWEDVAFFDREAMERFLGVNDIPENLQEKMLSLKGFEGGWAHYGNLGNTWEDLVRFASKLSG